MLKGIPASSGITIGKAFVISENKIMVKETIKAAEVLNMPSSEEVLKYIESVVNN